MKVTNTEHTAINGNQSKCRISPFWVGGYIFNGSGNTEDFCIYVCAKEGMSLRESLCLFAANSGGEKRHMGEEMQKSLCAGTIYRGKSVLLQALNRYTSLGKNRSYLYNP